MGGSGNTGTGPRQKKLYLNYYTPDELAAVAYRIPPLAVCNQRNLDLYRNQTGRSLFGITTQYDPYHDARWIGYLVVFGISMDEESISYE